MITVESFLRTDHKAVDKRDELHTVLGWVTGDSDKVPVVTDDEKPFGIVNERALMSRKLDARAKLESYTLATRALASTASPQDAVARMAEFRAAYLPVEDARGKLAGYVTALDLAREAEMRRVARDLALPIQTLSEGHTMGDALHLFTQEYVDVLPVMDGGKVSGVLPRKAIIALGMNSGSKGRKDAGGEPFHMLNDPVAGFMDEAPVVVPATTDWNTLLETLDDAGYAIVQDGSRLVGVVTPETLMRSGVEWG